MDRTDFQLQLSYLSLPRRPTGLGVCGQQAEGSGVALWPCCGLSSLLEFNKEMQGGEGGAQISYPLTFHCAEVGEVMRGSVVMLCFIG